MVEWLRDAYAELTQKKTFDFEELQPTGPYSNPLDRNQEADAKKWKATSRHWETLARIVNLRTKVATFITSFGDRRYHCHECGMDYGGSFSSAEACLCKCRLFAMVDEAFRGELESYPGYVELSLPRKLPILYLCPLKTILYSQ